MHSTESAARSRASSRPSAQDGLQVDNLDVFYGQAHALQGVSLSLGHGVLAVVGRNGMGKTTLCKAITGMVAATGSVRFAGREILGHSPDQITRMGIAYVPQGRRVWRSLTVDETLRLASKTARQGAWTVDRVYQVFPRLAERRNNGGAQLSGGEQQMLAIGRALLFNPRLLVMDEPTEGLAPVIVEQVASLLKSLAEDRSISVLLIEQNLGVALEVADDVAVMVNGRIAHCLPARELAADRALQQRLLGLKAGASGAEAAEAPGDEPSPVDTSPVLRLIRRHDVEPSEDGPPAEMEPAMSSTGMPRRSQDVLAQPLPPALPDIQSPAASRDRAVYLAGDWSAHTRQLAYVRRCLEQLGARVVTVDIAGTGVSSAMVGVNEIQRQGGSTDRGSDGLEHAFPAFLNTLTDLGALLVLAGSASAAVACAGALGLPSGVPKVLVTDTPLPGSDADVMVMTAPIAEFNRISQALLGQAASATVGMLKAAGSLPQVSRPLVCITGLGMLDSTVRGIQRALGENCDCLVLDMARKGAASLERLASSGLVAGVIDMAPVDIAQAMVSGDDRRARARLQALRASHLPYVLVPSLLEFAVYPAGQAVPARLLQREIFPCAGEGAMLALSRTEAQAVADWLATQVADFRGAVQVVSPQPSPWLQSLGGGVHPLDLQECIHTGLARRLKVTRTLGLTELPSSLLSMSFGESVGRLMRELLQGRTSVRPLPAQHSFATP